MRNFQYPLMILIHRPLLPNDKRVKKNTKTQRNHQPETAADGVLMVLEGVLAIVVLIALVALLVLLGADLANSIMAMSSSGELDTGGRLVADRDDCEGVIRPSGCELDGVVSPLNHLKFFIYLFLAFYLFSICLFDFISVLVMVFYCYLSTSYLLHSTLLTHFYAY